MFNKKELAREEERAEKADYQIERERLRKALTKDSGQYLRVMSAVDDVYITAKVDGEPPQTIKKRALRLVKECDAAILDIENQKTTPCRDCGVCGNQ